MKQYYMLFTVVSVLLAVTVPANAGFVSCEKWSGTQHWSDCTGEDRTYSHSWKESCKGDYKKCEKWGEKKNLGKKWRHSPHPRNNTVVPPVAPVEPDVTEESTVPPVTPTENEVPKEPKVTPIKPEESEVSDEQTVQPVESEKPATDSGTTTVKLCRNRVCTVGGNGEVISLINHNDAKNPTYDQLIAFAKADNTDEKSYSSSSYVCSDFAKDFHDNAEAAGIKAGWCASDSCNHAWNVFETTDKGIIYIDCTGQPGGATLQDKELYVKKGEPLTGKYLFKKGTVNMGCDPGELLVYW